MSPMSGHATGAFRGLQEQPSNAEPHSGDALDGYIKSLEIEAPVAFSRPRKLSQEDFGIKNATAKQNSGKNLMNLSEEANGSNKGGNKSSFSDSMSNPDLDEYLFNKHTPSGFTFNVQTNNSPGAAAAATNLRLHRQSSPVDGNPLSQPSEEAALNAPVAFKRKKHGSHHKPK